MGKQVFWDASAFIALGNTRDRYHKQAIAISRELAQANAHILTTDSVLIEVANAFSAVRLRPVAQQMIEMTRNSAAVDLATIIHTSPELWQRGWALYRSRTDKGWGLTDCISMIVMQDHGISDVFTSDSHFSQAGFNCLIKTNP